MKPNSLPNFLPSFLLAPILSAALLGACATPSAPNPAASGGDSTSSAPATPAAQSADTAPPRQAAAARDTDADDRAEGEGTLPKADLTREVMFQVLAAEVAAQNGQLSAAAATYLSLAEKVRDPRLARRATELALAERSLDHATRAAQLWYELAPTSTNAAQTVEALWLATGRLTEVEPLVKGRLDRARTTGTLPDAYQQLTRQLSRASDRDGALALLDRVSQPDRAIPESHLALAAIAGAAGKNDRAATEAQEALKLRPDNERAAILAAQYLQQSPQGNAGAEKLLTGFLDRQPKAVEARFTYARLLAADGKTEAASGQMAMALKQEPDNPAILISMAQLAYQLKQSKVAEGYLKRYIALPPDIQRDNATAYLFLAQIAEDENRIDDSIRWLTQITRGDQFLPALTRRAMLMGKQGKVDQARELLRTTSVSTNRERVQLTSAEAQVLRQAGQNQAAFDVLNQALERQPDNTDLLYDQAMAAERINRLDLLEGSLRKLIQIRPDHAHAYNALGYTFADRNIRLDEAQKLVEKALTLSPDDPHIIDSLGWVYYRKGELDKATETLRKAYAVRPEPDIAAHLGEVLWKAGKNEEARKMWQSAQQADPTNETLKETLARLNIAL